MAERLQVREIDDDEGARPMRIVRRGTGSVVTWRRAQMVLLSAQGMPVAKIAEVTFTSLDRVRDRPRPGVAGCRTAQPHRRSHPGRSHRRPPSGVHPGTALAGYLSWRRYLDEWVTVATTARDAAGHLDNPTGEGAAWNNLGLALRQVRRFDEAIDTAEQAVAAFTETGAAHDAEEAHRMLQAIKDAAGQPDPGGQAQP